MNPKEKAIELCDKYSNLLGLISITNQCKQCALIEVSDEILFALKCDMNNSTSGSVQYWKKVKIEIQNL